MLEQRVITERELALLPTGTKLKVKWPWGNTGEYILVQTARGPYVMNTYLGTPNWIGGKLEWLGDERVNTQVRIVETAEEKTGRIHAWMKSLDDYHKQYFAINWRIPHTLFNVACKIWPTGHVGLQKIDWYQIYNSRDMGFWSHGGPVFTLG